MANYKLCKIRKRRHEFIILNNKRDTYRRLMMLARELKPETSLNFNRDRRI